MKIAVFGMGYVGCVSAACLAHEGHTVVGVDTNPAKVAQLASGHPTIIEKDLQELVHETWRSGQLSATNHAGEALCDAEVAMVSVGTPSQRAGQLDLSRVYCTAEMIGKVLRSREGRLVVLLRSTVLPGTNYRFGEIVEEFACKRRGRDFEVVTNPEFLREGTAIADFYNPPYTVLGTDSDWAFELAMRCYASVGGPRYRVGIPAAETIKLVSNSWHALKVAFANEVGTICKSCGVDPHEVMDLFCRDSKLNLSSYYLRPGFAYGGSCLPKDLRSLAVLAHDHYLDTPIIEHVERSNAAHKQRLVEMLLATPYRRIGILGFAFKPGTDDLRNSPIVEVAEALLGRGYALRIYDRSVVVSRLTGTNRDYIHERIPHLEDLILDDLDTVVSWAECLIVANDDPAFHDAPSCFESKHVIDLVHLGGAIEQNPGGYDGICWNGSDTRAEFVRTV